MDPNQGEEAAPLVVVVEDGGRTAVRPSKNHARDAHILSFSFFFIFCAYSAAQNLESTVNTKGNLGTTSLGILYTSFTLFSVVASPVVRGLKAKRALVLGTTGYLLFIASNLKPSWYTMVPASLYLGFTASIIWVSQGTYLTSAALSHARDYHLHEGTVIGNFNGEFWGMFASTQVVGNLISFFLLGYGMEGDGANLLFTVFLGCMILGAILMCFLSKRDDKLESLPGQASVGNILKSVIAPLLEARVWLIIPLLAYSGLEQAFVWAEFTKHVVEPAFGVSGVGGVMAIFGAADAIVSVLRSESESLRVITTICYFVLIIWLPFPVNEGSKHNLTFEDIIVLCSLVAGRLTSGLSSVTWIVAGGAFIQTLVMLWLLFGYSLSSGTLGTVWPLVMATLWGVGDGVFNTQLNALLGMLFKRDMETAFAQLKLWQSGAIAVVFFLSPHISLQAMLLIMVAVLCVAIAGFLYLTLHVEKQSSSESHLGAAVTVST